MPRNPDKEDLSEDDEDCYWCGRVIVKSMMRKQTIRGIAVYICKNCQQ